MYYAADVVEELRNSSELAVFGAGIVAEEVGNCLMGKPYQLNISCFIVSDTKKNGQQLMGKPVIDLQTARERLSPDTTIIIAAMEKTLKEIRALLDEADFRHIVPMTFESDLWSQIRGNYYKAYCESRGRKFLTLEEELNAVDTALQQKGDVSVYCAKCDMDKFLTEDVSVYEWERPIQVGTALTSKKICEIRDDTGENISQKNRKYCEQTALYWIWKNDRSQYAGLCHYRRHFEMNEVMLRQLSNSDIDVILTIPILNFPSVKAIYEKDHLAEDWQNMLEAIRLLSPEYLDAVTAVQEGNYYYAYNMMIARKEILDDYCAWLFPILQYCEERGGQKEDPYQNRYLGFLSERLLTVYFTYHEKEYKIVHAEKHFIEN